MGYLNRPSAEGSGLWTATEHARFLQATTLYPTGPWRAVAAFVGTRNVRQTMTHAQKHKQKMARHQRGLFTRRRRAAHTDEGLSESDCDSDAAAFAASTQNASAPLTIRIPRLKFDAQDVEPLPLSDPSSFVSMLHGGLVTPLAMFAQSAAHAAEHDEQFALETPDVADCLDFLVRSFA